MFINMPAYRFPIIIVKDSEGMYTASVPTLPGCHTQAEDLKILEARIKEAIELYVEVERDKNHSIPQPKLVNVQEVDVPN